MLSIVQYLQCSFSMDAPMPGRCLLLGLYSSTQCPWLCWRKVQRYHSPWYEEKPGGCLGLTVSQALPMFFAVSSALGAGQCLCTAL